MATDWTPTRLVRSKSDLLKVKRSSVVNILKFISPVKMTAAVNECPLSFLRIKQITYCILNLL